jgi:CubicO group peptidase (beta-lactamase class C family)
MRISYLTGVLLRKYFDKFNFHSFACPGLPGWTTSWLITQDVFLMQKFKLFISTDILENYRYTGQINFIIKKGDKKMTPFFKKILFVLCVALLYTFTGFQSFASDSGDGLITTAPEKQGMSSQKLRKMDQYIKNQFPHIRSVLVLRNDALVFEKYYQNFNKNSLFEVASVTKTVTATLIGIAIQEGFLTGVHQKVIDFFPEYVHPETDPFIKEITIQHLLTMTSGFYWFDTNLSNKNPEVLADPIKYAFQLLVVNKPGETFNYNTLNSQILSAIISRATKMSELEFADQYLFGPLHITEKVWPADLRGYNIGGDGLELKSRDMVKIGRLYLQEGKWGSNQILSKEWIAETTRKHNDGGIPEGEQHYGYHCWVTVVQDHPTFFAYGFGGQFIHVIPDLKLVVVITSDLDQNRDEHRNIINGFILPSIQSK